MKGFVLEARSGHYRIALDDGRCIEASARKRLLSGAQSPIIAGDEVELDIQDQGAPVISAVLPRRTLVQRGSDARRGRTHSIAANLDRALAVFAADRPRSKPLAIDRYLVAAEYQGLEPALAFNKWDLADAEAERVFELYQSAGYASLRISATAEPEAARRAVLSLSFEKLYVFGPSGVGKTSLLNAVCPEAFGATGEVNETTGRGRHTTTTIRFLPLELDSRRYVLDTPGLGQLTRLGLPPQELRLYYREFRGPAEGCRLHGSCLHRDEPGCAVREALGSGLMAERYESYLAFLADLFSEEEAARRFGTRERQPSERRES